MRKTCIMTVLVFFFLLASAAYAEAEVQDPAVKEWKLYIKSLNTNDPVSINKAIEQFRIRFDKESQSAKDAAFMAFRKFYYDVVDKYGALFCTDEKLQALLCDDRKGRQEREKLKKSLSSQGMTLLMSEGSYYIGEDSNFLSDTFASQLSPALREFLTLRSRELKKGFAEDAGLIITWNELADRIAAWDHYMKKHGSSPAADQAAYYHHMYLAVFLTGMDNSRIFSFERKTLEPEVQKAYQYYLKTHKDTRSTGVISEYYSILKKNGLKESHDSRLFLKKKKLMPVTGIQPPTR